MKSFLGKLFAVVAVLLVPSVAFADPISAVVSVATMAKAATGAMTLMKGITFAASAVSLAGNVTGNKKLARIGAIASLAGGVGMWAESRGLIGAGAAAKGAAGPALGAAGQGASAAATQTAAGEMARAGISAPSGFTPSVVGTPTASGTGIVNTALKAAPNALQNSAGSAPSVMDKIKSFGSGVVDFAKSSPEATMMLASMGQGLAEYLSGVPEMELKNLRSQINVNDANAARIQSQIDDEIRRRENMNAVYQNPNRPQLRANPNASMQISANPFQMPKTGLVAGNMGGGV
jgi:hypothetical protein